MTQNSDNTSAPHRFIKFFLRRFEKRLGFKNEIKWTVCIFFILYHLLGLYWCYYYTFPVKWQTVVYAAVMYIQSGFGISMGSHRLWAHRTFKGNLPMRFLLLFFFTSAGHNSVKQWVLDHRLHHKYTDTDADPHNSKRGLFFSHIGWLMMKKNEEVRLRGKEIDVSDIDGDAMLRFQHKHFTILKLICCYTIPMAFNVCVLDEKWQCVAAWQFFIRYLIIFHGALTVNSIAHKFGNKPYNKKIMATQNRLVSIMTLGEGWHNFHHTFPFDYRATDTFDLLNWSNGILQFFVMIGWAYELRTATVDAISAVKKDSDKFEDALLDKFEESE